MIVVFTTKFVHNTIFFSNNKFNDSNTTNSLRSQITDGAVRLAQFSKTRYRDVFVKSINTQMSLLLSCRDQGILPSAPIGTLSVALDFLSSKVVCTFVYFVQ